MILHVSTTQFTTTVRVISGSEASSISVTVIHFCLSALQTINTTTYLSLCVCVCYFLSGYSNVFTRYIRLCISIQSVPRSYLKLLVVHGSELKRNTLMTEIELIVN